MEEPTPVQQREYANVLTRFGALLLDGLILVPFYIPMIILSVSMESYDQPSTWLLFLNVLFLLSAIVFAIWNAIFRMGKTGQSLGRKFLNIAVLDENGKTIGVGKAALREIIGRWISGLVCYIGYLNAFWDKDKQMWHDKMANCYVYYVEENFS